MEVTNQIVSKARGAPEAASQETRRAAQSSADAKSSGTAAMAKTEPTREEIERAFNDMAGKINLKVDLGQDEQSGRTVVRIYTKDGDKLLRQIPPEAVIEIMEKQGSGGAAGFFDSVV